MRNLGIEGLSCSSIYNKRCVVTRLLPPKLPTIPTVLDFDFFFKITKENYHMSNILPQNKHVRSEKETNKCGKMGGLQAQKVVGETQGRWQEWNQGGNMAWVQ